MVGVHPVGARATVKAGIGGTVVDVGLTGDAGEPGPARAHESPERVRARPPVLAGVCDAFVNVHVAQLTLPSLLAVALVTQVVRCVLAGSLISTRVWRAGGEHIGARGSTVGKLAQTGEARHAVHTRPLVQARAGRALVDVHLAQITSEALATLASEAIQLIDTSAGILTGTRETVVSVQVTVLPHPTGLTVTAIPIDVVSACTVNAGAAAALIHLRVAVRGFESLWTLTVEAVLFVHARPSIAAGT